MASFDSRLSLKRTRRRTSSFAPVEEQLPPSREVDMADRTIPAEELEFEVTKSRRVAQVMVAVIYCLLSAGVVFGFAAVKPILIQEGVYRDRCTQKERAESVIVCYKQDLRLNFMFTVAAVSTNVCALPVGAILDRYGPRIASLIGVCFLALGALGLAFAAHLPFDAYIVGYLFLALGGPFVFIPSFHLSNAFPENSGLVLALLTSAFDCSSAVFLAYRLAYQSSSGSFTLQQFFLLYLIVPAFILVAQLFIMPAHSYKTVGELVKHAEDPANDTHSSDEEIESQERRQAIQDTRRQHRESVVSEITHLLGSTTGDEQQKAEEQKAQRSGVHGALHGKTAARQIASPWFVLMTLFTIVQMTRINYFVATVRTQYSALLDVRRAVRINHFFDVALPLGGVLAVPFIGLVLDHTRTSFALALLVAFATAIGLLGLMPQLWAAYGNVTLFVLYRPFFYTTVSEYSVQVFGFETFGTVYGLMTCLAGLGNFSQAGLDTLTHQVFGSDPGPVNALLLILALALGCSLVGFVRRRSSVVKRESLEEDAEDAREIRMPEPNGSSDAIYGEQSSGTVGGRT